MTVRRLHLMRVKQDAIHSFCLLESEKQLDNRDNKEQLETWAGTVRLCRLGETCGRCPFGYDSMGETW